MGSFIFQTLCRDQIRVLACPIKSPRTFSSVPKFAAPTKEAKLWFTSSACSSTRWIWVVGWDRSALLHAKNPDSSGIWVLRITWAPGQACIRLWSCLHVSTEITFHPQSRNCLAIDLRISSFGLATITIRALLLRTSLIPKRTSICPANRTNKNTPSWLANRGLGTPMFAEISTAKPTVQPGWPRWDCSLTH